MTRSLKNMFIGIAVAAALAFAPSVASALALIDFGTGDAGFGGTITLTAGGNVLGTAIPLESLATSGTTPSGTFDLSGPLAFGNDASDTNGAASFNFDTTAKTFTVFGGVPSLGIISNQTLLTGTISSFSYSILGNVLQLSVNGTDTKSVDLLTALGIPTDAKFAFASFELAAVTTGAANTYTATSVDILNQQVAEPFTMLLLGTGLLGLAVLRKKL
jgi:hypothetical protein